MCAMMDICMHRLYCGLTKTKNYTVICSFLLYRFFKMLFSKQIVSRTPISWLVYRTQSKFKCVTPLYCNRDIQCHSLIAHREQTDAASFVCILGAWKRQYKNVNIGFWCVGLGTQASTGTGGKYALERHAGNHMAPHNMGAKSGLLTWHGLSVVGPLSNHGISFICESTARINNE